MLIQLVWRIRSSCLKHNELTFGSKQIAQQ